MSIHLTCTLGQIIVTTDARRGNDKTAPSSDRSFSCLLFAGVPVSACSLRQCQAWCVRTSKLDSGLGNLRTNQWRQYLRHPGTAYTYRPLEVRVVQGPLHRQCEHGLICDENRVPVADLPVLVFLSESCRLICAVLCCEQRPHLRMLNSYAAFSESVPDSLSLLLFAAQTNTSPAIGLTPPLFIQWPISCFLLHSLDTVLGVTAHLSATSRVEVSPSRIFSWNGSTVVYASLVTSLKSNWLCLSILWWLSVPLLFLQMILLEEKLEAKSSWAGWRLYNNTHSSQRYQ